MEIGRLHIITPEDRFPVASAHEAVLAGAPILQLRLKSLDDRLCFALASQVADLCTSSETSLIINDRVDLAQAVDADGVHLGADDLPVEVARHILGPNAVVGGTVRDPEAARRAETAGASYLGVGPVFSTSTKDGLPDPLGPERVGEIAAAVSIPVIAIGGVTPDRTPALIETGVHGVAVVGAVWSAPDPATVVEEMLALVGETR